MANTLTDLWNGNLAPLEQSENDAEMEELIRLIERNREKLDAMTSKKQQERLERYITGINEYYALFAQNAFCTGFRLGSRLFAESWLA